MYSHETAIKALQERDTPLTSGDKTATNSKRLALTYCNDCRAYHTKNSTEIRTCDIPF